MSTREDQPREGRLIEEARGRRGLSQNKAAQEAGISGTRWRQIVYGEASAGPGVKVAVHGNAKTVAQMARAVGVTPRELTEAGRADAARILGQLVGETERELSDSATATDQLTVERRYDDPGLQAIWEIAELPEHERRLAINAIQLWRGDLGSGETGQRLTGT